MNIIHLVSSLGIGGAEKFVIDLSIEQKKSGHNVTLLVLDKAKNVGKSSSYESSMLSYLFSEGVKVFFAPDKGRKSIIKTFFWLRGIINESRPEIVHSHLLIWSLFLAFTSKNYKSVFTQHTFYLRFPGIYKYFLDKYIDSYVAICEPAFESISESVDKNKISKIWNGVAIRDFHFPRKNVGKSIKLITVSRIDANKNHQLILRAIHYIKKRHEDLDIIYDIVGEGPNENEVRKLVDALDISDCVNFLGSREDVPLLLSQSDVFILSSRREGLSIALIEALSSRMKIIASDVGGNKEVLLNGKFGKLFKDNDLDQLIFTLESIILNDLNDNLDHYDNQLSEHLNNLSMTKCSNNHITLYKALLEGEI